STKVPFIASPIFDVTTGRSINEFVASPGQATGSLVVLSKNSLFGADAWGRHNVWADNRRRFDFLFGYQFARLDDSMVVDGSLRTIAQVTRPDGSVVPNGYVLVQRDTFATQNEYHAGALGFAAQWRRNVWSIELLGKVGL